MKILVLSPHTDDAEIGCGGIIVEYIRKKYSVKYIAFSHVYSGKDLMVECKNSLDILGIKNFKIFAFKPRNFLKDRQKILDIMIDFNKDFNPDIVFSPMRCDFHQDHSVIAEEAIRAFKYKTILGYEIPWNNYSPRLDCFAEISMNSLYAKLIALKQYESQFGKHYFTDEVFRSLAVIRGVQNKTKYAEAFEFMIGRINVL